MKPERFEVLSPDYHLQCFRLKGLEGTLGFSCSVNGLNHTPPVRRREGREKQSSSKGRAVAGPPAASLLH